MEHRTPKVSTSSSATGGRPSLVSYPWQAQNLQDMDYRPTGTENNECRRCTIPSCSTCISSTRSNTGNRSTPEARWRRNELIPQLDRFSVDSSPTSALVIRKRDDSAPTILPGIRTVPSTSPTNQGGRGGPGSTMTVGGEASGGRRSHRLPRGLCLGEKPILQAWTKAKGKSGSREWLLKSQLLCFQLPPYFWTPDSTLFLIFECMAVILPRGPKIQSMPGLSPLYGLVEQ